MSEIIDKGTILGAVEYITIKQTEKILTQMKKSICKIQGKLIGTGFFCYINNNIPCLLTNYHVLDDKFIKTNNKIKISINDNAINEEIIINEKDIIYLSVRNEYDLIIIKLNEGQTYMKYIEFLKLDENLFNKNSVSGYNSIYILHYPNSQNAAVSYGNGIKYDPNYRYYIQHKCHTLECSTGGPILNLLTNKVIGIHKGCIQKNGEGKYNIATFLKDPLQKIEIKDNKIKNQIKNDNLYKNFNIALKKPTHKLNYHTNYVSCLIVMNDGRLVSCSDDDSIIIYNKETYKPDLIIKEHRCNVNCIIQLGSGILVSCSVDRSIKLFKIKGNKYEVLQTLKDHSNAVNEIIELKNKALVSCSDDKSIIFFKKDNLKYKKDYQISTNGICYHIIQTKDNEICYEDNPEDDEICFYDLLERKVKASISKIPNLNMKMISKDLLLITGRYQISIINVNNYKIRILDVPESSYIHGVCMINQNMLLTGDWEGIIRQWRIEGDNLILYSEKEVHKGYIYSLLNLGNGHIASGSYDKTIKIW